MLRSSWRSAKVSGALNASSHLAANSADGDLASVSIWLTSEVEYPSLRPNSVCDQPFLCRQAFSCLANLAMADAFTSDMVLAASLSPNFTNRSIIHTLYG